MKRHFKKTIVLSAVACAALTVSLSSCKKSYESEFAETETSVSVEEGSLSDSESNNASATLDSVTSSIGPTVPANTEPANVSASSNAGQETTAAVAETTVAATAAPVVFKDRDETVYITTDGVNIRETAGTDGTVLGTASTGDSFHRTGCSDEWSRIEYNGKPAFISSDYTTTTVVEKKTSEAVAFNTGWEFGGNSKINSGTATLYYATGSNKKGRTICVNAGHGTKGGEKVKTLCHPDGTAKVTGGSTAAGSTSATAVSSGTTMKDGTSEAYVNLKVAMALKPILLERGYNVLMIRESDDVQLDNIARTVMANEIANCHIAIHYDSTEKDKGAFFMSVADGIKSMYPVSTIWQESDRLGTNVINGLSSNGVKIFSGGSMQMDLTQTSYSKIPSIDLELGDRVSDYSDATVSVLAKGIADGIDSFYS
ncbi:N-acetylmuramoyl-L-alanine amidase [Oribacterium sp. WCC10]|uniref:N-acetylmuramoyl-L-alanine amidase n=1 Tax=Oribacterium sp. WCC10 TaxID=1855343 RepID=UPI0008E07D5B|nr:N-acetylmuramoyl-L-alanine amidase [Oribacterium sp. WCC10]SFG50730.1 N-acetylmuramoyl-L-alanine amidase [Oribacterium sp. WCC10]